MKSRDKKMFNLYIIATYSLFILWAKENSKNGNWWMFAMDCAFIILCFIIIFKEMSHD